MAGAWLVCSQQGERGCASARAGSCRRTGLERWDGQPAVQAEPGKAVAPPWMYIHLKAFEDFSVVCLFSYLSQIRMLLAVPVKAGGVGTGGLNVRQGPLGLLMRILLSCQARCWRWLAGAEGGLRLCTSVPDLICLLPGAASWLTGATGPALPPSHPNGARHGASSTVLLLLLLLQLRGTDDPLPFPFPSLLGPLPFEVLHRNVWSQCVALVWHALGEIKKTKKTPKKNIFEWFLAPARREERIWLGSQQYCFSTLQEGALGALRGP